MEVWVFYVPALSRVLVPILLILSTLKFTLVAMFYMHLKFYHAWFSYVFVGPLLVAIGLAVALLWLFQRLGTTAAGAAGRGCSPTRRTRVAPDDLPLAPGGRARAGDARRGLSPGDGRPAASLRLGAAARPVARDGVPGRHRNPGRRRPRPAR